MDDYKHNTIINYLEEIMDRIITITKEAEDIKYESKELNNEKVNCWKVVFEIKKFHLLPL